MADFYIVTGGTGSNKHLVGRALARKFRLPLLFGESFYDAEQFELAFAGTPFDVPKSIQWADSLCDALTKTGGCVLVCKPLDGAELPIWAHCGCIFVVHADPTAEALLASWTAEQSVLNRTGMAERQAFDHAANVQQAIVSFENAIDARHVAYAAWEENTALAAAFRANPTGAGMDKIKVVKAIMALRDTRVPPKEPGRHYS